MALYTDLSDLARGDADLLRRCEVAVMVLADNIVNDLPAPATATEKSWAAETLNNPRKAAQIAVRAVLAANKDASVAVIQAANDSTLQGAVDTARDVLVASVDVPGP